MINEQRKARELFDMFCFIMPDINDDGSAAVKAAKQCAIIAVDLICETEIKFTSFRTEEGFKNIRSHYALIKEEIEKL